MAGSGLWLFSPTETRPGAGRGLGTNAGERAALGRQAEPRCHRHSRGVKRIPVPAQPPHSAFPSLGLLRRPLGGSRLKGLPHLAAGVPSACSGSGRKPSREGDRDLEPNKSKALERNRESPGEGRKTERQAGSCCVRRRAAASRSDSTQTSPATATVANSRPAKRCSLPTPLARLLGQPSLRLP